jgi:DNA-binding response OmpR family regulator
MPAASQDHVRILIVDDEPLIAFGIEEVLLDAGFQVAGVASKLDNALALIESGGCDAAIVDANLAGVSAVPIAAALKARNLPFIVLSGYSPHQIQGDFTGALFIKKPCRPSQLIEAVKKMLM